MPAARQRQPELWRKPARDCLEVVPDPPRARAPRRIHVRERAQNAAAAGRRRRKAVHVEPRVVLTPCRRAARDFRGTEARAPANQPIAIARQEPGGKQPRRVAETVDEASQGLRITARGGCAAEPARRRIEAGVLGAAEYRGREQRAFPRFDFEWKIG